MDHGWNLPNFASVKQLLSTQQCDSVINSDAFSIFFKMSPTRSLGSCAEWSEIIVPRGSNVSLDLFRGQDISLFFCFAFSLDRFWCQAQMESWVALVPPCPVETRRYGLCWCRSWTSAASTWIFILRNHRFSTSASKLRGGSMRSSKMLHGYLPLLINTYPNVGTYI